MKHLPDSIFPLLLQMSPEDYFALKGMIPNGDFPAFAEAYRNDPVRVITRSIMEQTIPNHRLGLAHAGNWGSGDLEFGVEVTHNDRGMGNCLSHENKFFASMAEVDAWATEESNRLAANEWMQGCSIQIYQWDLGPNLVDHRSL